MSNSCALAVSLVGDHEQPGVCWTNVFEQKAQSSKSLCPTRPRNDLVSRAQSGATAQQGADAKSARPLGPATPKPGEGGRRCHTKTWPMLMGKACDAGYATASSDPRRSLICTPAFPSRCGCASAVDVDGLAVSRRER